MVPCLMPAAAARAYVGIGVEAPTRAALAWDATRIGLRLDEATFSARQVGFIV
jgi:hypothetical protein